MRLYTGHNKGLVKMFDINQPHESPTTLELKINKHRKHSPISSIDCSPADTNLIAMGSFDCRIYFTDSRNFKKVMNYIKMTSGTGVTQVKFMADGKHMLIGSRRDNMISQWDIRYLKEAFAKFQFQRNSDTNQRMYFDVLSISCPSSATGTKLILASGNLDGSVIMYNISEQQWIGMYPSHFDSIAAIGITQLSDSQILLATGSGQRQFADIQSDDSSDSEHSIEKPMIGDDPYWDVKNGVRLWKVTL